jgi:phosphoribosylpyrophosphate synthetase
MKIGIVGARDFMTLDLVDSFIKNLPKNVVIVSGGAKGVDAAAKEYGKRYSHTVLEFLPDLKGCKERYEFTKKYYERNQKIAEACDMLVAFTDKDHGGTWDTIKRATKLNKPVKIIRSSVLFNGLSDEPEIAEEDEKQEESGRVKGKGPFHLKRITLGSFALNMKRYKDPIFLAELVNAKYDNPEKFADIVVPDFLGFFQKYKYGHIDLLTVAQRSVRNMDKAHPMDLVGARLSESLSIPFNTIFEPWGKPSRAVRDYKSEVSVKESAMPYIGKVVYVLDDVVTTGNTLSQACLTLSNLGIHTHGIAYIMWS